MTTKITGIQNFPNFWSFKNLLNHFNTFYVPILRSGMISKNFTRYFTGNFKGKF